MRLSMCLLFWLGLYLWLGAPTCVAQSVQMSLEPRAVYVGESLTMQVSLSDVDNPQRLAFRFILALILMRKKLLRYNRTEMRPATVQTDKGLTDTVEQEWWLLTPKLDLSKGPLGRWKVDESIEVLNPQLDEQRTQQVTEQLNEILNAEL